MTQGVREDLERLWSAVPTWATAAVLTLLGVSSVYAFLLAEPVVAVVFWLWLAGIGISVFVLYLLYRLVLATERIADGVTDDTE